MIITLPTPDFSMPYNVICLACTVVALAFGPLHNITTKSLRLKLNEPGSNKNMFQKIKDKFFKRKEKVAAEPATPESACDDKTK